MLEGAGFSFEQILRAATVDAAAVFSEDADFGSITPGNRADMLILGSDPTRDVAAFQDIDHVILDGISYDPNKLAPLSPAALVTRQLETYNAHDIDGFAATYSEDIELFNLPSSEPRTKGREALIQTFGRLFRDVKPNCRALSRIVEGNYVIDQEFCKFGSNHIRATAIYQVEDGLIRRVWFAR